MRSKDMLLCLLTILALGSLMYTATAADTIGAWQRWEHRLTSDRDYANPCVGVQIHMQIDGPDGQHYEGLGFWDGERNFAIRFAFPSAGDWKWATTCSDATNQGLNGQSGTVQVTPPEEGNPLTSHGYPRVSKDGRLLVYADGTPFLWLGDTCWAAPVQATSEEWAQYVANRAAKGYTVLQTSVAPDWSLEHSRIGSTPFLSKLPDITQPNPVFFQGLDRMIDMANDHGLVVAMVGLIETPYRYPPPEQTAILSRYVAARYASAAVIFSPSFDSGIQEAETEASAQAIREAAPANLITMHMGTGVGPHFHAADWLSFDMYQSGHNSGDKARQSARAVGMAAEVLALPPRKPLVNGEAIYEGDLGGAYDVRRTAWLSYLSGAVGYTAGINQVYAWKENAIAMMNAPSSDQVALLARLLRALPWWELTPSPQRILNQPDDKAQWMAFALAGDKTLGIAYLPENEEISLDLSGMAPTCDILWVNPATGRWSPGPSVETSRQTTLAAPDTRDWAVLLAAHGSASLSKARQALDAVAWNGNMSSAALNIAKGAPPDGLVMKSLADGRFESARAEDVDCLVNDNPGRNKYLYCDLDDRLAFRVGVKQMQVTVRLQSDGPLDGIQLQYDAGGPATISNRFQPLAPAWQKNRDGWTELGFVAESPWLGNRQNGCADFRLFLNGERCRIASLTVTLDREAEKKE